MRRELMTGDEAVARGVYEAGCNVAAAYPGTPSTEILENIAGRYNDVIYSQWACNEKVAFEIAAGASMGGARAFCAFKHVGMNVAADPIFSIAYAGVNGGLVFVTADDPGCHSSQNEQDNRNYAPHSRIAMLEPSDSQEAKDFTVLAYELSEKHDTPVMIRMTTRVCHSKSLVVLDERKDIPVKEYIRNSKKNVLLPANSRVLHTKREQEIKNLEQYAYSAPINKVEKNGSSIGVITSGISYQHSKEVFGTTVDYLKLGITYPLSSKLISEFASCYETLYVIEENDPYLENAVKALGFTSCIGKEKITVEGELNASIIRKALLDEDTAFVSTSEAMPARPPVLCAGCPHRGYYYALSRMRDKFVSVADIGCYTLGAVPPLDGLDSCLCMGGGFSMTIGMSEALKAQGDSRKVIGVLGDSTFFHSGMTGLVDIVASQANVIAVILDNSITAMTGHQLNPANDRNLMGQDKPAIDIEKVVRAVGISDENLRVVDPIDQKAMTAALKDGLAATTPFVIITKRPCILIKEIAKKTAGISCHVIEDKCKGCKVCMKMACPAMAFVDGKAIVQDPASCTGCGLCMELCSFDAIERIGE